jgi:hypothetical protein
MMLFDLATKSFMRSMGQATVMTIWAKFSAAARFGFHDILVVVQIHHAFSTLCTHLEKWFCTIICRTMKVSRWVEIKYHSYHDCRRTNLLVLVRWWSRRTRPSPLRMAGVSLRCPAATICLRRIRQRQPTRPKRCAITMEYWILRVSHFQKSGCTTQTRTPEDRAWILYQPASAWAMSEKIIHFLPTKIRYYFLSQIFEGLWSTRGYLNRLRWASGNESVGKGRPPDDRRDSWIVQ